MKLERRKGRPDHLPRPRTKGFTLMQDQRLPSLQGSYPPKLTILHISLPTAAYTGHFESVQEMADELDKLQERTGIDVPIHVDAASGGFVARE